MRRGLKVTQAAAALLSAVCIYAIPVSTAPAASPSLVYGEVARFGGLDTNASFGAASTSGLGTVGQQAQLVYPVAMAVDSKDPNAPDEYAIYVLENLNPQALNASNGLAPTSLNLEYRIQKISDAGVLLAETKFTLESSSSEPGLHAASLAVDGPGDRVYVMLMDVPAVTENSENHGATVAIDAWTTGRNGAALAPAVELSGDELEADPRTGGGELIGASGLQELGGKEFAGDIDGASIAMYGHGATSDLALGGNLYTSSSTTQPVIELIKTSGPQAGQVEGSQWGDTAGTENAVAHGASQKSEFLYSLSTNEGEGLNASLGGAHLVNEADHEPNMATISGSGLSSTTALLPSDMVNENFMPSLGTYSQYNVDGAATVGLSQDIHNNGSAAFMPTGGTRGAGTLAPSVVQLEGGGGVQTGLYAGLVIHVEEENKDQQNPENTRPTWTVSEAETVSGSRVLDNPSNLGVRVFNAAGESVSMIGNVAATGPCKLSGSPAESVQDNFPGYDASIKSSFVALASGREGVVFMLAQPELLNTVSASAESISPTDALGASEDGDQIVEFAPASNEAAAGGNASNWHECPQPEGGFSITNETLKEPPSTGGGEISVLAGTKLKFDAGEVNLHGASPWAYDWELEGGSNKGEGPIFEHPWTVDNTFTQSPGAERAYLWPLSTIEAEFNKAGEYTETLNLVNDFGALTTQRTLRVIEPGKITGTKISPSTSPTEGQPVLFNASANLPSGDKVKDYHWEFGDGTPSEDTGEHAQVEHTYAQAGEYPVKLTVTDVLGQKAQVEEAVVIAKATTTTTTTTSTSTSTTTSSTSTSTTATTKTSTTTTKTAVKKPLTKAQKLAAALKVCKKDKPKKKRANCEKQARTKYGNHPRTRSKAKKGKKK